MGRRPQRPGSLCRKGSERASGREGRYGPGAGMGSEDEVSQEMRAVIADSRDG